MLVSLEMPDFFVLGSSISPFIREAIGKTILVASPPVVRSLDRRALVHLAISICSGTLRAEGHRRISLLVKAPTSTMDCL